MQCPHCTINFHENWLEYPVIRGNRGIDMSYRTAHCPECKRITLEIDIINSNEWRMVYPIGSSRGPVPNEVPANISKDYVEACIVLPFSAHASAALSRRCLQNILHNNGYTDKDLSKEIDLLLNEPDPKKAIPNSLRNTIDGIRNFGNFSAHPINDKTTLQIIDVEEHEAEWCLEIIEEMFQHFYVGPAISAAKKAALDAKLQSAGKPLSK